MPEDSRSTTVRDFIDYLDGRGLSITDYELIEEALEYFDADLDSFLTWLAKEENS